MKITYRIEKVALNFRSGYQAIRQVKLKKIALIKQKFITTNNCEPKMHH